LGDATHYQRLESFVIDPIFVGRFHDEQGAGAPPFPYYVDTSMPGSLSNLQLPRLTLASLYFPSVAGASSAAADRVFTSQDDLKFFEYQRGARGNIGPDNNANNVLDAAEVPQVPIIDGNYSYLVMVTPSEMENPVPSQLVPDPQNPSRPLNKAVPLDQRRLFTVQVVVFYKRNPTVPQNPAADTPRSERQIPAQVTANNALLEP